MAVVVDEAADHGMTRRSTAGRRARDEDVSGFRIRVGRWTVGRVSYSFWSDAWRRGRWPAHIGEH